VEDPRGRYDIFDAMAFEISESGMSAATPNILLVGEHVELNPVMGFRLQAIVRRKSGAMYGFEFAGLPSSSGNTYESNAKSYACSAACWTSKDNPRSTSKIDPKLVLTHYLTCPASLINFP
jgi:hypothetical protein